MTDPKQNTSGRPHLDLFGFVMLIAMALAFGLAIRFLFNVVLTFVDAQR